MAAKKKKLKPLHGGRSPTPKQRAQYFSDKRKKREKGWRNRIRPEEE